MLIVANSGHNFIFAMWFPTKNNVSFSLKGIVRRDLSTRYPKDKTHTFLVAQLVGGPCTPMDFYRAKNIELLYLLIVFTIIIFTKYFLLLTFRTTI